MMQLYVFSLVLLITYCTSPAVAHADGALAESCYDHALDHTDEVAPGVFQDAVFENCTSPCIYQLNVTGYWNENGDFVEMNVGPFDTFDYTLNTTYQITLSRELNGFLGFLIQARGVEKNKVLIEPSFDETFSIIGTWQDMGPDEPLYRTLSCGISNTEQTPGFINSVTHQDSRELSPVINVSMYWTSPDNLENSTRVVFYYTVLQQIRSVFYPATGPIGIPPTVPCLELPTPANGLAVTYDDGNSTVGRPEGTMATYPGCNNGYTLFRNTTRTCLSGGTWSGDAPICKMACSELPPPANGLAVTYDDGNPTVGRPEGTVATYPGCNNGYTLFRNTTRTCLSGGTWSGDAPACDGTTEGTGTGLGDTQIGIIGGLCGLAVLLMIGALVIGIIICCVKSKDPKVDPTGKKSRVSMLWTSNPTGETDSSKVEIAT